MFELMPLPFDAGALAPRLSRETIETHHGKHHASYIEKTNALIEKAHRSPPSLEDVVRRAHKSGDEDLFNNAAQAWNHGFFWQCLAPAPQTPPDGALAAAIESAFGAWTDFETAFCEQGAAHFGSGWLWLVSDRRTGKLSLEAMHDAGAPIVLPHQTPLLVCDLWEHAYYLDYKNERPKFLKAFIGALAHWRFAEEQFRAATEDETGWAYPAPVKAEAEGT